MMIAKEPQTAGERPERWGVYIHIPFCRQKCFYCDFPSWAGREKYMQAYTEALCWEIQQQGSLFVQRWGQPATIYIGGGTPTALSNELLEKLLVQIEVTFGKAAEFTVEANPGTVDAAKLALLRQHGVNRLSLGVQSFDDALLRRIGRIHTGAEAVAAFQTARAAVFTNVSLDLMYGLPGQSLAALQASVEQALALAPEHISIYGLQLEENTAFARMQELGKLDLPSDDATEAMYDYMTTALPAAGYARYEISNFARPGYASRHNLAYWQDVPYLGLGAAAHSYLDGQRWANVADIEAYLEAIHAGQVPRTAEEPATREIAMEEFAFLALRTATGISRAAFARKFGVSLDAIYGNTIARLVEQGALVSERDRVHLTARGAKYGNMVFEKFLLTN